MARRGRKIERRREINANFRVRNNVVQCERGSIREGEIGFTGFVMLMKRENRDGRRRRGLSPRRHPLPRAYIKSIFRGKLPAAQVFFRRTLTFSLPAPRPLYIYIYIPVFRENGEKPGVGQAVRDSCVSWRERGEGTNNETASIGYLAC